MLTTTLFTLLIGALGQTTVTTADPGNNQPALNISAHLIRAPHSVDTSTAGDIGTGVVDSFAWSNGGCGVGAGHEPSRTPTVGWHFTGRVLQRTGDTLTVQIDWQRVWDRDARVTDPKMGTVNKTMKVGERVELDRVEIATSTCGAGVLTLDATVSDPSFGHGVLNGVQGGRGGGVFSGASGGAAGGRGGTTSGVGAGSGSGVSGTGARAGGRGGASGGIGSGSGSGVSGQGQIFAAELWLVHTGPGATMASNVVTGDSVSVAQQTVRFPASGSGFVFAPVPVGNVSVIVTGTVSARLTNGLPSTLVVTIGRQVTGTDAPSNGSSSTKEIPWPKPDDVISFELPRATGSGQDALAGHQFALRLRLQAGR